MRRLLTFAPKTKHWPSGSERTMMQLMASARALGAGGSMGSMGSVGGRGEQGERGQQRGARTLRRAFPRPLIAS